MILKNEKSFHIRLNMNKPTDREIWEWLHNKEQNQTISVNAFLIEVLRRSMIADSVTEKKSYNTVPDHERSGERSTSAEIHEEPVVELSEEALEFLEGF